MVGTIVPADAPARGNTSTMVVTSRIETTLTDASAGASVGPGATGSAPGGGDAGELLTAVADPSRLAILRILTAGPRCVCNLQTEVAIAANLLSYHLKVLRDIGLIHGVRRGRWIDYHLAADAGSRLHAALPLPCPTGPGDGVGDRAATSGRCCTDAAAPAGTPVADPDTAGASEAGAGS